MTEKTIRDLMIPIEKYAVVDNDATVRDALIELRESQARLSPGSFFHRSVLIRNKDGTIVGKIGHWALLKAVEPRYKQMDDVQNLSRAGLTSDFVKSMAIEIDLLKSDLRERCRRIRSMNVTEIMRPVTEQVDISVSLSEAIHSIVTLQTLSIVITDHGKAVGLLRLSDLFHVVREIIISEDEE